LSYGARREHDYSKTCAAFSNSLDVLLERLLSRANRSYNSIIISISLFVLAFTINISWIPFFDNNIEIIKYILDSFSALSFLFGFYFFQEYIRNEYNPQKL